MFISPKTFVKWSVLCLFLRPALINAVVNR